MYGINAAAFLAFVSVLFLSVRLCRHSVPARMKVLHILCAVLLSANIVRYTLCPVLGFGLKLPVEYSAVSYFAVPVILLLPYKKLRCWAAYSGLASGFFYYAVMIFFGGGLYADSNIYNVYFSMFCHGSLLFCGMIVIGTEKYRSGEWHQLAAGTLLVIANALLLRPLVSSSRRIFIYDLFDAEFITSMVPRNYLILILPVYYIAVAGIVFITMKIFFGLNARQYGRFAAILAENTGTAAESRPL